jgi:hypothetical protein
MGFHYAPTTLIIGFNQPLDPSRADNPAAYTIVGPGGQRIAVGSAVYDAASRTVKLDPVARLNLHKTYFLTVSGTGALGLTGADGLLLDGAGSGRPGSDYTTTITMANWTLVLPPPLLAADPPAKPVKWTPTLDIAPRGPLALAKPAAVVVGKK